MEIVRNLRADVAVAAGAYGETEIALALSLESSFLFFITDCQVLITDSAVFDAAAAIQWQVTRTTQTAIIEYNDRDLLWAGGWQSLTSGIAPLCQDKHCLPPYAVACPSLFFGVANTGGASTVNISVNLGYFPKKVPQRQFWEASQTR